MKLHRRHLLLAGATLAVAPGKGRAAEVVQVMIPADRTVFEPAEVRIKVGDTVEWTNTGIVVHTVTCDPAKAHDAKNVALPAGAQPFGSEDLEADQTFRHTFTGPGTYRYFCIPHQDMGMVGAVTVSA